MISVDFGGTIYEGRLISIFAHSRQILSSDGFLVNDNYLYSVTIKDAYGAEIRLEIEDLKRITFF